MDAGPSPLSMDCNDETDALKGRRPDSLLATFARCCLGLCENELLAGSSPTDDVGCKIGEGFSYLAKAAKKIIG